MKKSIVPEIQNSTEIKVYEPTFKQLKWLDTAISLETDVISEIARECGIDRTTWYEWRKTPGFLEWWNTEWEKALQSIGWRLDVMGLKNAKKDYSYWKSMQQRLGRLQDNKAPGALIQQNFYEKAVDEDRTKYA